MNIDSVLFDLDNTLILFDEKEFYKTYTFKLSQHFKDVLTPQEFAQKLMHSTQIMTNNNGEQCNADFFVNDFSKGLNINKSEIWNRFEYFYKNEFEQLKYLIKPLKNVKDLILKIQKMNKKIVIASNPMLPENVQYLRLKWAGLEKVKFDLITDALNSTYCKPNINYYIEISDKLNLPPNKCLMVGNDPVNDMIAAKTGMITYLTIESAQKSVEVSRQLAGSQDLDIPKPDYYGKLENILYILDK